MLQKKLITLTVRIFLRKVFQNITSYCKLCKCTLFLSNKKRIFIGKTASAAFRNLRNKYSRENKKLKALHKSICNELEVVTDIFISHMARTFCVWKRDYFKLWRGSRKAVWKWPRVNRRHYWQWHYFFSGSKKLDISYFVTEIKPHRKRSNKQADRLTEQEVELPKVLTPRLTHSLVSKYDNALYGELLASKFMNPQGLQKLQTKHKIDNVIFKYLLVRKGSATRTLLEPSANQVGAKFHICCFRPVKWWGTCHYSPATNKHVPTTPKANGNYVYPTYSRWRFWESLIPITKKLFTYADILIVPDNQLVLVIFFERTLETIENTCSNNEFHEEKQLFVFVRKYHFVCNLPNFMD